MSSKKKRRPRGHRPPIRKMREFVVARELDERVKDELFEGSERRQWERQADDELAPLATESMNESERPVCPDCGGEGRVTEFWIYSGAEGDLTPREVGCRSCMGRGFLTADFAQMEAL